MRKIELQKTYEEFEINGNVYRIDTTDEKMLKYGKDLRKFQVDLAEIQTREVDEEDDAQVEAYVSDMRVLMQKVIESFFGAGSFSAIYKDSGESIYNVVVIVEAVGEFITESIGDIKEKQKAKYKR